VSTDWLVWQIADSAFPTGGFAHSWGLESAWQHGEVRTPEALRAFVGAAVVQAGYASLPFVTTAYRQPDRLEELDDLNDAFLTNRVANRASRVQGRALAATSTRVWPSEALVALEARARNLHAHCSPLAGAIFKAVTLDLSAAQRIVLYLNLRGVLSAAVRLGIVGNFEAQRIQYASSLDLDTVLERCGCLDERAISQTAPVQDLLQAAHDRLYSRLFQS
jgi:urease accessory protein